jgi:hypothetical protein
VAGPIFAEGTSGYRLAYHPVLFIGSAPPKSAIAVFEAISEHVGELAVAVPDGDQAGWWFAVLKQYKECPQLEPAGCVQANEGGQIKLPLFRLKPGVAPADLRIGTFGYAVQAEKSYAEFKRLRTAGKFPADTRFQVTFPTPLTTLFAILHRSISAACGCRPIRRYFSNPS